MTLLDERQESKNTIEYLYKLNGNKAGFYIVSPELQGVAIEIVKIGGKSSGEMPDFKTIEDLMSYIENCKCRYYEISDYGEEELLLSRITFDCHDDIPFDEEDEVGRFYLSTAKDLSFFYDRNKVVYKKVCEKYVLMIETAMPYEFQARDLNVITRNEEIEVTFFHHESKRCFVQFHDELEAFKLTCKFKYREIVQSKLKNKAFSYNKLNSVWSISHAEIEVVKKIVSLIERA